MSRPSKDKEVEKIEKQFDEFNENIKEMTLDRMNAASREESEPQTKLSSKEIERTQEIYLQPKRRFPAKEKFNEKFADEYAFKKEKVRFIAENKEIIGESIDMWTKPFPGVDCEEWEIPVNKVVWAPRYVAEQISKCSYHRFIMQDRPTNSDGTAMYYGVMTVDTTIPRLDARPVSSKKSIFMGASNF